MMKPTPPCARVSNHLIVRSDTPPSSACGMLRKGANPNLFFNVIPRISIGSDSFTVFLLRPPDAPSPDMPSTPAHVCRSNLQILMS
jgi:hypothetical protein